MFNEILIKITFLYFLNISLTHIDQLINNQKCIHSMIPYNNIKENYFNFNYLKNHIQVYFPISNLYHMLN